MLIRKSADGRISLGAKTVRNLTDDSRGVRALKKPIPILSLQINEPFEVETTEGIMRGQPGDWLMQGVAGELYICPDNIFKKSYDILDK
jgi:PGDYG protein